MAEIKRGLKTTPEVTRYFDGKTKKPAFSWLDVYGEEHAYSMTVAKAVEAELLGVFEGSISKAIAEGKGFDSWKEDIRADLARLGWWQPRMVADPTGIDPDRIVDFSSDRRLKTIFWSNVNSARSAGQWERAQRTKAALPYILYVRTTSGDPRPEHLAWVGLILPVDHPFWRSHWPPNGWLCKCQVRQISAREAERLMGTTRVIGKDPQGNDISIRYTDQVPDLGPDIQHRNRRKGEITNIPQGIDPGWHTNPGMARAKTLIQNLETKLADAPASSATTILQELWEDPYLRLAPKLPEKTWLPAGVSQPLADDLVAKSPVISVPSEVIVERIKRHKMDMDDFALLPELLALGLIFPDLEGKPKTRMILHKIGKTIWRAFVSSSANGYLRVNSLHEKNEKQLRQQMERAGIKWPWG